MPDIASGGPQETLRNQVMNPRLRLTLVVAAALLALTGCKESAPEAMSPVALVGSQPVATPATAATTDTPATTTTTTTPETTPPTPTVDTAAAERPLQWLPQPRCRQLPRRRRRPTPRPLRSRRRLRPRQRSPRQTPRLRPPLAQRPLRRPERLPKQRPGRPRRRRRRRPAAAAQTGGAGAGGRQARAAASVYYANCSAVRAAGADPIYAGQPGYSRKLDRDGDGIACE